MQDYHRPESLEAALALLGSGGRRVLAGGTDLYPGAGVALQGGIVDLSGLAALRGIEQRADGLWIGAATTWAEVRNAALPPALAAMQQAASNVGGVQIQNAGTVGGNLCNASPAADGVPPLLVCDAEVHLRSVGGGRSLSLADFLTAPRRTALLPGEVLAGIWLPKAGLGGGSVFEKLGARAHLVISIAMVAVRLTVEAGRVGQVAIAVGSCSGVALRLPQVERALIGAPFAGLAGHPALSSIPDYLAPIDDIRASAGYRAEAATVLVRRALSRFA